MWVRRPVVLWYFWYKVCKFFWCHAFMKCAPPFCSWRFSNLCWSHISPPFCSKLWSYRYVEVYFLPFSLVKKRSSTPLGFLGLSSNVFTFDYLFTHRSDVFNNSATSLTKWPEYRKNRFLSSSINSVRVHFRERVEKTKENGKNTTLENLQNGQEKYGGKNSRTGTFGAKI